MKQFITKFLIVAFSLMFAVRVGTIFIADTCYNVSKMAEKGRITPDKAITLLNIATNLDSTNANLYFQKYELLDIKANNLKPAIRNTQYAIRKQQLHLLKTCINLCPSWPAYHLFYALTLNKFNSNPNIMTQKQILSELQKASELKPYSKLYSKIYKRYLKRFSSNE